MTWPEDATSSRRRGIADLLLVLPTGGGALWGSAVTLHDRMCPPHSDWWRAQILVPWGVSPEPPLVQIIPACTSFLPAAFLQLLSVDTHPCRHVLSDEVRDGQDGSLSPRIS